MANIVVRLQGTRKIYRYEKGGKKFLREEPISERKVFITTPDGECIIDGEFIAWNKGNEVYKEMVANRGHREYDSHCGRYNFLNIDDVEVIVKKIDTKDYALELAKGYAASVDPYVDYIDNGAQWESTRRHNHRMDVMECALKEIAETL